MNKVLDIYVACLSTCIDCPNQWNKYACSGAGFAIGFRRAELEEAIQPSIARRGAGIAEKVHLVDVRYSEEIQKQELREFFERHCAAISPDSNIDQSADKIVNDMALHASCFKRPCFTDEMESRIVIETLGGRSDLRFRSSVDKVIPYIKTAKLPVASIIIGPAMDQEASHRGVQALLDTRGYRKVKIWGSELQLAFTD